MSGQVVEENKFINNKSMRKITPVQRQLSRNGMRASTGSIKINNSLSGA